MKKMNKLSLNTQQGFTLIELVVVIVILGILAATAAPKFIDLTGDAKKSTIKALRGSVESATTMVHAKALVTGTTDEDAIATLSINGVDTNVIAGWPTNEVATWNNILDISADDFLSALDGTSGDTGRIVWYPAQSPALTAADAVDDNCYVSYVESTDKAVKPAITINTDDC